MHCIVLLLGAWSMLALVASCTQPATNVEAEKETPAPVIAPASPRPTYHQVTFYRLSVAVKKGGVLKPEMLNPTPVEADQAGNITFRDGPARQKVLPSFGVKFISDKFIDEYIGKQFNSDKKAGEWLTREMFD